MKCGEKNREGKTTSPRNSWINFECTLLHYADARCFRFGIQALRLLEATDLALPGYLVSLRIDGDKINAWLDH